MSGSGWIILTAMLLFAAFFLVLLFRQDERRRARRRPRLHDDSDSFGDTTSWGGYGRPGQ